MSHYDFVIIGAGIAGASLAAELAPHGRVALLEAEDRPGYHATGRSAAFWEECYGGPEIVPLTLASGPYLRDGGFLRARGALYIGRSEHEHELDAFMHRFGMTGATLERLDRSALCKRLPGVRSGWTGAVWEPACADIDVAALHAHYLRLARHNGCEIILRARVSQLSRSSGGWQVETIRGDTFSCRTLVNAAGAWADQIGTMAGARPLGIRPLRRTVAQVRVAPAAPADLPLVLDIGGGFYFKPEGGRLWLSPHDEEPSPPCDAAPEEMAVAVAIDRLEKVVDWQVEAVEHKWAGLRSFAPDRRPVYGYDPDVSGFFWFAGQGGFGIQTSPAAARLAGQLLLGRGSDALTRELEPALYAPDRFRV